MAGLSNGRRRFLLRRRITLPVLVRAVPGHIKSSPRYFLTGPIASKREVFSEYPPRRTLTRLAVSALGICLLAILSLPASTLAQSNEPPIESKRVAKVTYSGNLFFSKDQLSLHVRTRPNRNLLGIPGFTWWLWIHQLGAVTLGGKVGRAFQSIGEPPAHLDSSLVAADIERLRLYYEREGFRSATVQANVIPIGDADRVRVEFQIDAGRATFIRTVKYNGLDHIGLGEQAAIVRESLLPADDFDPLNPLEYRPTNLRYSEPLLELERGRLMTALRNSGYAAVGRDSIHAVVWPAMPDSFDVTIDIRLGPRYRFGNIDFFVAGPVSTADDRNQSEPLESYEEGIEGGVVQAGFSGENILDFDVLTRALRFHPGDTYRASQLLATKRRLDATGVFSFTEIVETGEDSTRSDETRINHRFNLQTRLRHQIRFKMFMLQRTGALAETDNELGAGVGITYSNLNLFGGGERFELSTNGSLAADLGGSRGFTSAQWEVSTSLSYPYLTFPLGALDRLLNLYEARTRFSITLLAARRDALRLVLRGKGRALYRFELRHSRTLTSFLDLVDITVSNPDTLDGFQVFFLDNILRSIDDPVQAAQIVEDYTRPQFNNALRYTFRSANVDPFRRSDGYAYESSFEVGGNLGFLLDRYVFSPGEVEGSLPGLPFFRGEGSSGRMIYRQYVRFVTDLRRYLRINSRSVVAWKFIFGLAHPTGDANVIPFDRRFYSGGASSVRAWSLRELGPGSASFISETDTISTETTNLLGGEIKLETSVEFRHTFGRNILAADWIIAVFADAGNVWFGSRNPGTEQGHFRATDFVNEVGVGAGVGIRLAWDYLIVRLDMAFKVHDPLRQGVFFPDKLKEPLFQFGIGHAF
ncbi:MAG: BamA/TamA family outer membrane protein [Rhodothermia bacterium]|nr:MAG: BamA/TamA family outer membrane protein [Rhodothermia bacterium]